MATMEWFDETVADYWHIFSDGKRADIPFLTDEDKIYARNSVAICAFQSKATILAVTINDTHLHMIVRAPEEKALRLKDSLRNRLYSYFKKGGRPDRIGDGLYLACDTIHTRTELKQKIIYVLRNCLDFFPFLPGEYPWGSGNIYFARSETKLGKPLGYYSKREQISILQTNTILPQDWRIDNNGSITPASFVDYMQVEAIFFSVRAFIAFLFVRKEDEEAMKRESGRTYLEYRKLEDLRQTGNRLSQNYCKHNLRTAPFEIRMKVASRMIRERQAVKSESLAKALFLKKEDLDRLI